MPELKPLPCPACGSQNCNFGLVENYTLGYDEHFIECWCCDMQGPYCDTEEAAIAAWNALPRALTWTTEPPTVPGWYWARPDNAHPSADQLIVYYIDPSCVPDWMVQWAGPITPPRE